jgi:hypothetical protein
MTENVNSISLNAYDVWKSLDLKDGDDDTIKKPIWDAFRNYTGVKANTIKIAIKKENALKSIESYLSNSSNEIKQKIAEFCGLSSTQAPVQNEVKKTDEKKPTNTGTAVPPKPQSGNNTTAKAVKAKSNNPTPKPSPEPSGEKIQNAFSELSDYQVNENWGANWVIKNSRNRRVARNTTNFDAYFEKAAATYNVPKSVLQGICMKESTMGVGAPNNIMQLEPGTARENGCYNRSNPEANIMASAKYLRKMIDKADGNIARALVAYNAGPGSKAFRNWKGIHPGGYADRVLSLSKAYERMNQQNIA